MKNVVVLLPVLHANGKLLVMMDAAAALHSYDCSCNTSVCNAHLDEFDLSGQPRVLCILAQLGIGALAAIAPGGEEICDACKHAVQPCSTAGERGAGRGGSEADGGFGPLLLLGAAAASHGVGLRAASAIAQQASALLAWGMLAWTVAADFLRQVHQCTHQQGRACHPS